MRQIFCCLGVLVLFAPFVEAQNPEVKFVANTLVVQAEGAYETDPDLATLTFDISSQEKTLKQAYDEATQSMQTIVALADRSKLKKEDISTGVLTVTPYYEGERKKRARSYSVRGQIVLKVHDFALIGPLLDGSVEEGIADLRSLTYSLMDEEAAKQRAVAVAMQRAIGRANSALEQKGQKVGALRYASLDVHQLVGVVQLEPAAMETVEVHAEGEARRQKALAPPPLPALAPTKMKVSATVQCAFQIL